MRGRQARSAVDRGLLEAQGGSAARCAGPRRQQARSAVDRGLLEAQGGSAARCAGPSRWVCLTVALAACGADNSLGGSVGDLFPLDVSHVELRRNDEALQLTYLSNRSAGIDVVIRLSVALAGVELREGKSIKLQGEASPGHPRTTVANAPAGEAVRLLPPVQSGDLTLSSGGAVGQAASGDFSMSFQETGGDLGQGRNLHGRFSGELLDGGF